jgi:hypothetical protein
MRKFQDFLDVGDALGRLNHQAQRLAELDRAYKRAVPRELAEVSGVDHVKAGSLFLWADGGAVAAKLRHLSPMVLSRITRLAPEVSAIRVIVQVSGSPAGRPNSSAKPGIGEGGAEALRGLVDTLAPSPLKTALARLAERGGTPSEDGK